MLDGQCDLSSGLPRSSFLVKLRTSMDKRIKTRWEKQMLLWKIVLVVLLPLLFGLAVWLFARFDRYR
jgi:hypothetical protein